MLNCWARIETNVYNRKKGFIKFIFCPKCICLVSRSHLAHLLSNQQFLRAEQTVKVSMAMGWSPWQMFCHGLGSFFLIFLPFISDSYWACSHTLPLAFPINWKHDSTFLAQDNGRQQATRSSMHSVELQLPSISLLRAIRK